MKTLYQIILVLSLIVISPSVHQVDSCTAVNDENDYFSVRTKSLDGQPLHNMDLGIPERGCGLAPYIAHNNDSTAIIQTAESVWTSFEISEDGEFNELYSFQNGMDIYNGRTHPYVRYFRKIHDNWYL